MGTDPEFYEGAKRKAHALYLQGWSYRDIAANVLPGRSGGFVTVSRWAKRPDEDGVTWETEREALGKQQREDDRRRYLGMIAEVKDRNLSIAAKASQAIEMSLEQYFEYDIRGNIIGVKMNAKTGLPVIGPRDMAPMLHAITEIHNKTLGMDQLLPDEVVETTRSGVVESQPLLDPVLAKRIGDLLAQDSLHGTVVETTLVVAPVGG